MPEATALAERLARGPSAALAVTKEAIDLEAAMDLEAGSATRRRRRRS